MKKKPYRWKPKRVLRLPDLDHAKTAVLNSLGSPESERSYRFAIDDFIAWYCSEPRLAFNKTVVLRYRLQLEARRLSASTINVRLAAVRPPRSCGDRRKTRRPVARPPVVFRRINQLQGTAGSLGGRRPWPVTLIPHLRHHQITIDPRLHQREGL